MCCLDPVSPEREEKKEGQMSESKINDFITNEHRIQKTKKEKQDLYIVKKGQLTTETLDDRFNNAFMWVKRSSVRFM